MLSYRFTIPDYDWNVEVYYKINNLDNSVIYDRLCSLACKGTQLNDVIKSIKANAFNSGFTYSNYNKRSSIIVIAKTTTPSEFISTFFHEVYHLVTHICDADDIDFVGEEPAYLAGHICQIMYIYSKPFICNHENKRYINHRFKNIPINDNN